MALVNADSYWMPFTDNRGFKADPRLLVAASGMHYTAAAGHQILDGTAGLWCVNAGHGRARIVEAIQRQAATLDYAPSFNLGHPLAFELAGRLAALMPADLDHVFFTGSGSESVDTALKIALAYHRANGEGARTRLIGRERGYHGVGFGGVSVGGIGNNRRAFISLPGVDHLPATYDPTQAFSRGQPPRGADRADVLEAIIALHGAETIAAVIVEPMAGSTGVLVPPVGYLEKLRAITRKHGIILIFDEVITAFGRLGAATAAERFNVTPDIITVAKGLTNGAVPMGAAIASSHIYHTILANSAPGIELFHGYTYSGHPLAAAAGLATLEVYAEENLFSRAMALEETWADTFHGFRGEPHVRDVRNIGLTAAIELDPAEIAGQRGYQLFRACFDAGLLVRVTGDTIALSPPLIITASQIAEIADGLRDSLRKIA